GGSIQEQAPFIRIPKSPRVTINGSPIRRTSWFFCPQLRFLHQDHRRSRRERLGHRGNAEDGVPLHWGAAESHGSDRVDMSLAMPADQRDKTGHAAARDVSGHNIMAAITSCMRASRALENPTLGTAWLLPTVSIAIVRAAWPALLAGAPQQA